MLKSTLYIQRRNGTSSNDDVIRIYENDRYSELYQIVYSTPEWKKEVRFHMGRHLITNYIGDLLKSFNHDTDPFDYIQISTSIHPSVMYHISDLGNPEVRHLIEDMVYTAIRTPIERVNKE
jgi:hypothetical protein